MPRTQLSWQPGFSLSRKPIRKPAARRTKRGASSSESAGGSKQFEFIKEVPASLSCYGRRNHSSATPTHSGAASGLIADSETRESSDPNNGRLVSDNHRRYFPIENGENDEETEPYVDIPLWTSKDRSLIRSDESADYATELRDDRYASLRSSGNATDRQLQMSERSDMSLATSYARSSQADAIELSSSAVFGLPNMAYTPTISIPPSILYSSLSERFRHILDRCMPARDTFSAFSIAY